MRECNAIVAVCDTSADVEAGIRSLQKWGFDLQNVSVVGPGAISACDPVAYYQTAGRMECWGKPGVFWTRVWDLLFGWAFVFLPEFGSVIVAGPLAMWMVAALENAPLFAGLSAVGAGLYSIGIPRRRIMRYEAALKRGMYLVVVHGPSSDVFQAQMILRDRGRNSTVATPGERS